ncbi:MAG TPA: hypothetical protein VF665_18915 [Longimicrobium sp.]|jgi:hypothetical protein|uniref:hypothetical protein n=1 Tax=Longimicrobium sp. TaxID=2029185 RepID=UPI002EDB0E74
MINPREVSLEALRELALDRAEQSSIRVLAAEIGLGPSTLHNFLSGATPHPRVRRKLAEWFVGEVGAERAYPDQAYASALGILLSAVDPAVRDDAAADVLGLIERVHVQNGTAAPAWLRRLRDAAAPDPGESAPGE